MHPTYDIFSSFITYPFQLLPHSFPAMFKHFAVQIIPYGFLGSICYILDVIFLAIQHRILRALVDNMAHGVIAFVSWCVVSEVLTRKDLADGVLSAFIACALDVDHFIAARSFNLQVSVKRCKILFLLCIKKRHSLRLSFAPCKAIQESIGFSILRCGFQIPDTGSWILDSQDCGFHN